MVRPNFINFRLKFHAWNREKPGSHCYQEVGDEDLVLEVLADQSAATAIEYGLIAAGISLAIIAVVNGLGSTLNNTFTTLNNSLK